MAKKKKVVALPEKIAITDIVEGSTYITYVNDIVKIEKVDNDSETITLFNATGAHRQWIEFRHIYLVKKIR